ncbi:MAG: helix-hairpin-helix domain-containing protein [Oscillospiraceae bacterium]|nr:helix-hairpin-helix domain-containing protein [Oscillospiraceae bacterium]
MKKPAHRRPELLLGAAVLCVAAGVMFFIAARGGVQPVQVQATTQHLQAGESPFAQPQVPTQPDCPPTQPVQPDQTNAQGQMIIGYTGVTVYHVPSPTVSPTQPPVVPPTAAPTQPPTQPTAAQSPMVNINTADLQRLQILPGIGPARAQAILDWRAQHGAFSRPEQLLEISGIGTATLMNMLPFLYI